MACTLTNDPGACRQCDISYHDAIYLALFIYPITKLRGCDKPVYVSLK